MVSGAWIAISMVFCAYLAIWTGSGSTGGRDAGGDGRRAAIDLGQEAGQ